MKHVKSEYNPLKAEPLQSPRSRLARRIKQRRAQPECDPREHEADSLSIHPAAPTEVFRVDIPPLALPGSQGALAAVADRRRIVCVVIHRFNRANFEMLELSQASE